MRETSSSSVNIIHHEVNNMKIKRPFVSRHIIRFLTGILCLVCLFSLHSCIFVNNTQTATTHTSSAEASDTLPPEEEPFAGKPMTSEIVYPNNAKGAVSFVVDDGYQDTTLIISEQLLPKYENLRISYALIANSLAELDSDYGADGIEQYFFDINGNYEYFFTNRKNVNFWTEHLAENDYCEVLSHSYTHSMWGNDDNGGEQIVQTGNGTTTLVTAKGAVTVELKGSQQIVRDLLDQTGNYFVMPGTGQANSQYYLSLLQSGQYYRGARTTNKVINNRTSIKAPFSYIDSWMVTPSDTVSQWTDFIDEAVAGGNWACFCIHNIIPDNASTWGHYMLQSGADTLFGHADALAEQGDLWIGTMSEVADYLQYWNASTSSALYNEEQNLLRVSLHTDETVAEYDVTLTVKVALPNSWSNGVMTLDGEPLTTVTENGETFVLVPVSSAHGYTDLIPTK